MTQDWTEPRPRLLCGTRRPQALQEPPLQRCALSPALGREHGALRGLGSMGGRLLLGPRGGNLSTALLLGTQPIQDTWSLCSDPAAGRHLLLHQTCPSNTGLLSNLNPRTHVLRRDTAEPQSRLGRGRCEPRARSSSRSVPSGILPPPGPEADGHAGCCTVQGEGWPLRGRSVELTEGQGHNGSAETSRPAPAGNQGPAP